ncbi:hypothetical protein [Corynebacterium sp. HS2168-gen11]|uniref:hypothetical protein n=1 Tax=Corynebacterium sp. HS2168-gen11 TaxID=2974027 RepID=UPI00216B52A0|nr:hypothetical protein [Corynebacterium sp. HS2168-gen11]MCS4536105.1 hypothetical protein [Corynebacterium sp. HS2168-gen11]
MPTPPRMRVVTLSSSSISHALAAAGHTIIGHNFADLAHADLVVLSPTDTLAEILPKLGAQTVVLLQGYDVQLPAACTQHVIVTSPLPAGETLVASNTEIGAVIAELLFQECRLGFVACSQSEFPRRAALGMWQIVCDAFAQCQPVDDAEILAIISSVQAQQAVAQFVPLPYSDLYRDMVSALLKG